MPPEGSCCPECLYPAEKFVAQGHFDTCSWHPANRPGRNGEVLTTQGYRPNPEINRINLEPDLQYRRAYPSNPRRYGKTLAQQSLADSYSRRASMPRVKIFMVYTKLEDIPVLCSVHTVPQDAIMAAAEDPDRRIGELPENMDFAEAVKIWEASWLRASDEEQRRARLKEYLTEEGYDEAKIDELVYHSDNS